MDSATAVFATVLAIFGGAISLTLVRGALWGITQLASKEFSKTNEIAGAVQPFAAFLKGPMEQVFGKTGEFKMSLETILLASIVLVVLLAYGELSAMRAAAKEDRPRASASSSSSSSAPSRK
jgi:hypothetical protein